MAADDLKTEYHLTTDGWVTGTSRFFGRVQGAEVPRPTNAVETWEEHIYQSSPYSKEDVTSQMIWRDESIAESARNDLHEKFPAPFPKSN